MNFALIGLALKYGPTVVSLLAKYGPQLLPLVQKYGPMVVAAGPQVKTVLTTLAPLIETHGPAVLTALEAQAPKVIAAALLADQVLHRERAAGAAAPETAALSTFIGHVVAAVPALKIFEPHILAQVQSNADAAVRLQSGGD